MTDLTCETVRDFPTRQSSMTDLTCETAERLWAKLNDRLDLCYQAVRDLLRRQSSMNVKT